MICIKVNEVQSRIKIGVGRTLNDCFITKNRNVASNMKLSKIENVAGIMERRKYKCKTDSTLFNVCKFL